MHPCTVETVVSSTIRSLFLELCLAVKKSPQDIMQHFHKKIRRYACILANEISTNPYCGDPRL